MQILKEFIQYSYIFQLSQFICIISTSCRLTLILPEKGMGETGGVSKATRVNHFIRLVSLAGRDVF